MNSRLPVLLYLLNDLYSVSCNIHYFTPISSYYDLVLNKKHYNWMIFSVSNVRMFFFYIYLYPVSSQGVWYDELILSRSLFFFKSSTTHQWMKYIWSKHKLKKHEWSLLWIFQAIIKSGICTDSQGLERAEQLKSN